MNNNKNQKSSTSASAKPGETLKPEQIVKAQPKTNQTPLAKGLAGFRNSIKARFKDGGRGKSSKSFFVKNTKTITLTGIAPAPLVSKKRIRFIDRPNGKSSNSLNYEVYEPKKKARRSTSSTAPLLQATSSSAHNNDVSLASRASSYASTTVSSSIASQENLLLPQSKGILKKTSFNLSVADPSAKTRNFTDNDIPTTLDSSLLKDNKSQPSYPFSKTVFSDAANIDSNSNSYLDSNTESKADTAINSKDTSRNIFSSTANVFDSSKNSDSFTKHDNIANDPSEPSAANAGVNLNSAEGPDDAAEDPEDPDSKACSYSIEDQYLITKQSKAEIKAIIDTFNPEQRQRYEVYRRTALSKSAIKKLVSAILNQQISQTLAFVIAGFGKVFIGEIVELALTIMDEKDYTGPIEPKHLLEAYQRYSQNT
ncbi:hypothetical protein BB561_004755 [Smittium simulii]|uniref:Transcription initiation factor TFIID subunit 11 n=1 Tax=Smittium simulii TaxID=133385 RepID=A0A2T9YEF4_9FUNG|nr:hypothetical protein BB561_004755 [Smittium simulii]